MGVGQKLPREKKLRMDKAQRFLEVTTKSFPPTKTSDFGAPPSPTSPPRTGKGPPSPQKSTSQPDSPQRPQPGRRQERHGTAQRPRHAPTQAPRRRAASLPPHGAGGLGHDDEPGPQPQEEPPPPPPLPLQPAGRGRTRSVTEQRGSWGRERAEPAATPSERPLPEGRARLGPRHAGSPGALHARSIAGTQAARAVSPLSLPVGDGDVASFTCGALVRIYSLE